MHACILMSGETSRGQSWATDHSEAVPWASSGTLWAWQLTWAVGGEERGSEGVSDRLAAGSHLVFDQAKTERIELKLAQ